MERVFFKSDTLVPVATVDGKIDFRFLGKVFGLEPYSIRLGVDAIPTNEDLLSKASWTDIKIYLGVAGTKEDPVLVNGHPVVAAPTGPPLIREAMKELHDETRKKQRDCIQGWIPRDVTVLVLEKLTEPFGCIPESLDLVELQTLLRTDLRTRIPCSSHGFASRFSEFLEYSTSEECMTLECILGLVLEGPLRPDQSSEKALLSVWDRLLADLPQLIHEVLNLPISTQRNIVDESLSTCLDRRDYLLFLGNLPVVFGEEKRFSSQMEAAKWDLLSKHRGAPRADMYGRLGYVICYAAAGQSCIQFFALPVGVPYPKALIQLTETIDPSTRIGRVELLKTFVNVIRWIHTVHRKKLIGGLLLFPFFMPFRRPSPYDLGETEIILYAGHVRKSFKVPREHLDTLKVIYRLLLTGKIRCSIKLDQMIVDGTVELQPDLAMEEDSEETVDELPIHDVVLKLRPVAQRVSPHDEEDSKLLVSCILKAISDLHSHDICHRDVRMANILRAGSEWILIDFELAGKAGDCVFWHSSTLTLGSRYSKDQDLKQLAGVIKNLPFAGPSLLQFAGELKKMQSAAQALECFVALTQI